VVKNKEIKQAENSSVLLTVTVGKEELGKEYQSLLQEYSAEARIPGFRKGKVPVAVLEQRYGEGMKGEVSMKIMDKAFREVVETLPLEEKPIMYAQPTLENEMKFSFDEDFSFTLKYDVFPKVNIAKYKGYKVECPVVDITKDDEQKELDVLRDKNAVVIEKDSQPVAQNDIVTIDYCEVDDKDSVIEASKREDYVFTVGTGYNLYKIDEEIKGMKTGEDKIIAKTYPADFEIGELAGRNVRIKVKIKQIREKQLPALDDELAQDISDKYKTLDDLKADVRKKIEDSRDAKLKDVKVSRLMDQLVDETEIILPKSMIDAELASSWRSFAARYNMKEDQLARLFAAQGKSKEDVFKEWEKDAVKSLKTRLIMNKIIENEKIEASPEDLEAEYQKEADNSKRTKEEIKQYIESQQLSEYLVDQIRDKKLFDFLIEQSDIKKGKKISYQDLVAGKLD
jgi:trigger factor